MTVVAPGFWKVMDGKLGVDLNTPLTSVSFGNNPYPEWLPGPPAIQGDRVQGADGSEWMWVKASTTVTVYNVVAIDPTGVCNNITASIVASNRYVYGVALFNASQVDAGDYFWAARLVAYGGRVNFASTAAAGAKVYVSGTAGQLTTAVTTTIPQMVGIAFAATITGATTANEVVMYGYMVPYVSV